MEMKQIMMVATKIKLSEFYFVDGLLWIAKQSNTWIPYIHDSVKFRWNKSRLFSCLQTDMQDCINMDIWPIFRKP